ncbi:MAG: hypothetical protein GDA50_06865 [Alphaproteobacteria bacterium GM202ARS2]|nr:hypothetical protein [Alphaproteobacteria bacterium GM202ARS2]
MNKIGIAVAAASMAAFSGAAISAPSTELIKQANDPNIVSKALTTIKGDAKQLQKFASEGGGGGCGAC